MNNTPSKNVPKIKSIADVEKYLGSLPCGKYYIDKSDADERLSIFKEPVDTALKCGHIHIMICRQSNPPVQLTPCFALWYQPGRTCAESNPDKTYRHKALSYVYEFRKAINSAPGVIAREVLQRQGYNMIYHRYTNAGEGGLLKRLVRYELTEGYNLYRVKATYAKSLTPSDYYIVAPNQRMAKAKFKNIHAHLNIITSVELCKGEVLEFALTHPNNVSLL